ncbi:SseB family protein [Saccharomonospora sp. NPDC006951]
MTAWQPANSVERGMVEALTAGDSPRFGGLLREAPFFVPDPESVEEGLIPLPVYETDDTSPIILFTSPQSLSWVTGGGVTTFEQTSLAEVTKDQPGERQLVINPATPIGAAMSLREVEGIASGEVGLLPMRGVQEAMLDEMLAGMRTLCIEGLKIDRDAAMAAFAGDSANQSEKRLLAAVDDMDFDAFLVALLAAEVVVLESGEHGGPDFPYRAIAGPDVWVVPIFSSEELLDRLVPDKPARVTVGFRDLVGSWPGSGHVLCLNPGTSAELILPHEGINELVAS